MKKTVVIMPLQRVRPSEKIQADAAEQGTGAA